MENVDVIKICEKVDRSFYTEINIIKYKDKVFRTKFCSSREMVGEFNINCCVKILTNNGWVILADRYEICPELIVKSYCADEYELKENAEYFLNAAIKYIKMLY